MSDLVSIIIPTHNRPEWLAHAIRSALDQSYEAIEVIVVDDGSELDINQSVVQQFPEIKYIYQKNLGLGAARNRGLSVAMGRYVQFLDDDDWLSPDAICEKMKLFASNLSLGLVYSDLYLTEVDGEIISRYYEHFDRPLPSGDLYSKLVERNFIPIHALLWKRGVIERIGGFASRSGHEDWESLVRAAEFSAFSVIDEPLGFYRQHGKGMSYSFSLMYQGKLDFQTYIASSERFNQLPSSQRIKLLVRFSLQQWAYGSEEDAVEFLRLARQADPKAFLPFLLRLTMVFGRSFAKKLIKGRNFLWGKFRK